jgi:hypothetical protein
MDLVLLGYQLVFSHKLSLLPIVRLLTYLVGEMAKKRGFEKSLSIISEAIFKTTAIFPDPTDNCRIHYYQ